jgi:hypothetical protein
MDGGGSLGDVIMLVQPAGFSAHMTEWQRTGLRFTVDFSSLLSWLKWKVDWL